MDSAVNTDNTAPRAEEQVKPKHLLSASVITVCSVFLFGSRQAELVVWPVQSCVVGKGTVVVTMSRRRSFEMV